MAANAPQPARTPEPEAELEHVLLHDDEMNKTQWSMPVPLLVGIGVVVVALILVGISVLNRPVAAANGRFEAVTVVPQGQDQVLVTMKLNVQNTGSRDLHVRHIRATVRTEGGEKLGTVAVPADYPTLFRQYPDIREATISALRADATIPAGLQERGSIIVAFPVGLDSFNRRSALTVTLDTDQQPITITK